jgi:hypothetical protein
MKTKSKHNSLEKEKLEIIKWVTGLKDESAIEKLKMLRRHPKDNDWWTQISEEEKAAIDKGLADIKAARVASHKEARKVYEKWL